MLASSLEVPIVIVWPVDAGLLDQLLGPAEVLAEQRRAVVGGVEDRGAVAEGARVGQPARHQRGALVDVADDRLPVQRQRQRLAHLDVRQRAARRRHDERVGRLSRVPGRP